MNYHFKNNNIYYGGVLVAEDMRDATKRLNDLEEIIKSIASELGVDPDMLIARDDVEDM